MTNSMNDKERQEYKKEVLTEVMIRVDEWCRYGRGINDLIIRDICDVVKDDKNI